MNSIRIPLLVGLLASLSSVNPASAAQLIDFNATDWRWRPGTTEASAPTSAWRAHGFTDTEFVTAPAPFWYGDVRTGGTQIAGMQNVYLSLFLRKNFNVAGASSVGGLRLRYFIDDGLVVWVNGTEVFRENVGDAAPTIASVATNQAVDPAVLVTTSIIPISPGVLLEGANTIAVQVFQSAVNSTDLGFDLALESSVNESTPPIVQGAAPAAGSSVVGLSAITVTFSEPVSGVDAGDLYINGAPANAVTPVNSSAYTFNFAQPPYGSVFITWNPSHGITDSAFLPNPFNATGPGATWQYTLLDQVPPVVANLSPVSNETVRVLTNITVTFSESVMGVNAGDLRLNGSPATGLSGGGSVYTFSFTQPLTGVVSVAWTPGHGITDLAAVPNPFAGAGWQYTLDPNAASGRGPIISEFMALNSGISYLDEDGESSDWIEVENASNFSANLQDWALTDDLANLFKWRFPSTNVPPGGFLVVFASEKDRRVPGARLHTNFKLEGNGEYLALVRPDGSIATAFSPVYPPQVTSVSFGFGVLATNSTLVATNAPVRLKIPSSGVDGTNWLYLGFNDASWTLGTNGVGFGSTNVAQADYSEAVLPTGPLGYWRMNETGGSTATSLGSSPGLNGSYTGAPTLGTAGPRPPAFRGFEPLNNAPTFAPGFNSYVNVPNSLLNNRSIFTMAGWIRPAAAQAARSGLFGQNDCVEFGFISASGLQLWTFVGQIDFPYPFAFGEWHHIAAVGTGSQLQLYLDGTLRASSALGVIGTSGYNFSIGGGGIFDVITANGNYFNGQIDEVAVWGRALSGSELLGLYTAGTNPVGVATVKYVATDVGPVMSNINASAYVRLPFSIPDPGSVQLLTLRVRHDDGFVAYLNGVEVARANAPGALTYNSAATNIHGASVPDQFQFGGALLTAGANVLAIHALNASAADEDFLCNAELVATHAAVSGSNGLYMTGPSPGLANGGGVSVLGPTITGADHTPQAPTDSQDIVVTARITPSFAAVNSVAVRYRIMFGADTELAMFDDGLHGDGASGDGIYGQTLPVAAVSTNGQLIRWYFRATDTLGNASRWPLFLSPVETEYLGTVVNPAYVTSQLPVIHLFAPASVLQPNSPTTQIGADSEAGARVTLFYDGELYDNINMELRGNTSATENKKAHRLEFNSGHEFRHPGAGGRIRKTSFLSEPTDSSYLHQHLSFWFLDKIGVPSPFDYPIRLQLNGVFYQLAFHNDVIGEEQIERLGYDPAGALYKAVGNVKPDYASTGGFVKLEPDGVTSRADYDQLAAGINEAAPFATRKATVFDLLDVPEVINHLVGVRWCSENDDVWANMCLYRDTFGDQLWRCVPFDMNASWGQRYGGNNPLEATVDTRKSHPLYGGVAIDPAEGPAAPNRYNRLYDVIIAVPETRQMLLRRMRTVMDRWILPPGTPAGSLIIETYIQQLTNRMAVEATLDRAKWGNTTWAPMDNFLIASSNLMSQFVGPRRAHWYGTHCITNTALITGTNATQKAGIPQAQPAQAVITLGVVEFNPASSNQAQEFITLSNANPFAIEISDWKLSKGVEFTFTPGTVIPSNSVLYVSPNVLAFKQRTTGPRGGQGLFVVGPYQGQLSARGESLVLRDSTGFLVFSNGYPGAPSAAQQFLRLTEIMYNPAPADANPASSQELEYLELRNIGGSTLDLSGVRFTGGITFAFSGSAISSLPAGGRVLVVRNTAAFNARYGGGLPVAGQFVGTLDNAGERLQLVDGSNEEIHDFSYNNTWYPITDGLGFSLVVANDSADPDLWGNKSNWLPSGALTGSPGLPDPGPQAIVPIVVSELLTASVTPAVDAVELHNPSAGPVHIGGWFLSDDQMTPKKYRITNGCTIPAGGYLTFTEAEFNSPSTALIPFAFSSSGDEAWLTSGDANTNLTGYMTGENFGASAPGVNLGRYTNSQGAVHFVAQADSTFGGPNGPPRVGPIVISEIVYRPPDTQTLYGPVDNTVDEYIELRNISGVDQPLYDTAYPSNTWRLRDAVDFILLPGTSIPAGGHLLLVSFDPLDAAATAAFRARNAASILTPLVGPYQGKLDNSSDSIELVAPISPTTNGVPYRLVERVQYESQAPWPTGADGSGQALVRVVLPDYGNDATNWVAAAKSPGYNPNAANGPSFSLQPQNVSLPATRNATFTVAAGPPPIAYQWRFNGGGIAGANGPTLVVSNIQPAQAGQYSCLAENPGGVRVSESATLTVRPAPTISQHPTNLNVRIAPDPGAAANTTAVFRVVATTGNPPLTYQWLFNGTNLPPAHPNYLGVTSNILTVTNITSAQAGPYACALTDAIGTVFSQTATLTTLIAPVIISQPQNQTMLQGEPLTLSIVVSNVSTPPFTYVWRQGSAALRTNANSFAYSDTITLTNLAVVSSNVNRFRCDIASPVVTGQGVIGAFAFITVLSDFDRDRIADYWEVQYGFSTNDAADAALDLDGDGMSNVNEYLAGTQPNDPASLLKMTEFQLSPAESSFHFLAISNRTYSLQAATLLPGPWNTLLQVGAAPTNRTVFVTNAPALAPPRYIRVVTPGQP